MIDKKSILLEAFCSTVKPEQKLDIRDWAKKYVTLERSSRSDKADLTQTPWLIQPLREILGNRAEEVVIMAPTGGGKSTMLEIAVTYIVAERPGPTLFASQSDPDAYEAFQTGFKPALTKCDLIKDLWPTKKHHIKKDFIQFPHMPLYIGGANKNNLQSKSCDNVLLDEAWCYKQGMIQEARRRTHDRFNSKVVIASQAGLVDDDLTIAWNQTYQHEYCYKCDKCGEQHPYRIEDLKFECDKVGDEYLWESLVCWYECPSCGQRYEDNTQTRRHLSSTGEYVQGVNENPIKDHIGYRFNALCVWWIPWSKIIIEFLKAKRYSLVGNLNYLKQFNQKRLAQPWSDYSLADETPIVIGDYKKGDVKLFDTTLLTADVQKRDVYYVVRTWNRNGESKLVESDKVLDWDALAKVQEKYNIPANCVFIDSAYRTEEVKQVLAKNKWLGLNGRKEPHYTVRNHKTGKTYKRIFSAPNRHKTAEGEAIITYYSSNAGKDLLFILKAGHGAYWGIPSDIDQDYLDQIQSEIKVLDVNGKPMYKKVKVHNHKLDCECMQIIGAIMHSCYPSVVVE